MKTNVRLWYYLSEFFLEWEVFHTKVTEKIKTHILGSVIFFSRKSCRLWNNLEKYCTAGQATDDSRIRRMRFTWWINKATNTHSEYLILNAFPLQHWLHERATVLHYVYIASLYIYEITSHIKLVHDRLPLTYTWHEQTRVLNDHNHSPGGNGS
jgi:hypothetical protein